MAEFPKNLVECRSEYDYPGRPTAFWWQGNYMIVKEVFDSWRTPSGKDYRIAATNGDIFVCSYSEIEDSWIVQKQ